MDLINNNINRDVQEECANRYVHIAAMQMKENNEYFTVYTIESCKCYETEFEFRSLMA